MQAQERQKRIVEFLRDVEFASLEELAERVEASVSTVRRDVSMMDAAGILKRTHGGARRVGAPSEEPVFGNSDRSAEKEAIGKACAELIQPHETIIIDAGTTVYQVARNLEPKSPQIITNSLPVANFFASSTKVEVIVSGGVLYPRLGVMVGPTAVEAFSKIHADVAIMSAGGVTMEGISNSHGLLIEIQLAMIRAAKKVIFCFDSTKLGRRSMSHLCGLDCIDTLVTSQAAPADLVEALRSRDVEVILAPLP